MSEERWCDIPNFSNYRISDHGRVYNIKADLIMSLSYTAHGHTKITLASDWDGERLTRSVAQMVAEAFVEPPNELCDHVTILDGNLANVRASNLVWRPRWFSWKYSRQLKFAQPNHYHNLEVEDHTQGLIHHSVITAGMSLGLLFDDVWRSTYTGHACFPTGSVFSVVGANID